MEHKVLQVVVYRGGNKLVVGLLEVFPNGSVNGSINQDMISSDIAGTATLAPDGNLVVDEVAKLPRRIKNVRLDHISVNKEPSDFDLEGTSWTVDYRQGNDI